MVLRFCQHKTQFLVPHLQVGTPRLHWLSDPDTSPPYPLLRCHGLDPSISVRTPLSMALSLFMTPMFTPPGPQFDIYTSPALDIRYDGNHIP